jgi:hypothetical protein
MEWAKHSFARQVGEQLNRRVLKYSQSAENVTMTRIKGTFDGTHVVLDAPLPVGLKPNTPVEVVVPDEREQALCDFKAFLAELWQRPVPSGVSRTSQRWTREELHARR